MTARGAMCVSGTFAWPSLVRLLDERSRAARLWPRRRVGDSKQISVWRGACSRCAGPRPSTRASSAANDPSGSVRCWWPLHSVEGGLRAQPGELSRQHSGRLVELAFALQRGKTVREHFEAQSKRISEVTLDTESATSRQQAGYLPSPS